MSVKKYLLAIIALFCLTHTALADENEYSKQFSTCSEKAIATVDIVDCINKEIEYQDVRLNKAYKVVMERLSDKRKKSLRTAQRAWIKFRDANCAFYHDPEGGSIHLIVSRSCLLEETASRAKELENMNDEYSVL